MLWVMTSCTFDFNLVLKLAQVLICLKWLKLKQASGNFFKNIYQLI